jgi:2,3-bisphosphoglycerate-independent phosphoglycerate mutase
MQNNQQIQDSNSTLKKTKILCILDGFGLNVDSDNNCISRAQMPVFRSLLSNYYWTTLDADGSSVGQEHGLVGNSEVGHMNIGGLKLIPQLSYQITKSSGSTFDMNSELFPDQVFDPKLFFKDKILHDNNPIVHLIGLFGTGTIHSDMRHLAGAIEASGQSKIQKIVLHLFSDGRDSDKKSLLESWIDFSQKYTDILAPLKSKIFLGSIGGRFYGMDRDNNLDRVYCATNRLFGKENQDKLRDYLEAEYTEATYQKYLDHLEASQYIDLDDDNSFGSIEKVLEKITSVNYANNIFDEMAFPIVFEGLVKGDMVWLFNFRSDRMKEYTKLICESSEYLGLGLSIIACNSYDIGLEISEESEGKTGYYPMFRTQIVKDTLAQEISHNHQSQLHIAETEKYAHVTYFLNGGNSKVHKGEDWVIIPSNKVDSHAELPQMKAREITDYIIDKGIGKYDYIIVNYANPDMVGHTGNIEAGIESMEFLDTQLGRLVTEIQNGDHSMIIIADHGNIESTGEYQKNGKTLTDTEHNPSPVPFIIVDQKYTTKNLNPELSSSKIISNLQKLGINIDHKLVINSLQNSNCQDYSISWLSKKQIEGFGENSLPLWYSGAILIGLE